MAGRLLRPEQLTGIEQKLKRADESMLNLDAEITTFLKQRPEGGFSEDKQKALDEWLAHHVKRGVPPRFSIIAGEIIHHLRSCLDHLAWTLSTESYRRAHETAIAFPIIPTEPRTKDEIRRYKRQVEGISSTKALRLINDAQPYHSPKPHDHPLFTLHELDRVDKHHEIVLAVRSFNMGITIPRAWFTSTIFGAYQMDEKAFAEYFAQKVEVKVSGCIAFAEFGQRKNQPIIPSLQHLAGAVKAVVGQFSHL
jgi:hypothetical protein